MNANELAKAVTDGEGLRRPVDIANVKEVLRVANALVGGALYRAARGVPAPDCDSRGGKARA